MKASVGRIVVLGLAVSALNERRHAGVFAVVRDPSHDRQAWAAMGAVGKRVAVATVVRIEDLGATRRAGRGVSHNAGMNVSRPASRDREGGPFDVIELRGAAFDRIDASQRRALFPQVVTEAVDDRAGSNQADQHPIAVVDDVAAQRQRIGNAPDGRPKSDPLDQSAHADVLAGVIGHDGEGAHRQSV
jgi:hypothetical protein